MKPRATIFRQQRASLASAQKIVIDHIKKHGSITTDQLKNVYGYDHPPRAIRDVREAGIALETFYVSGEGGRRIGAYRFASDQSRSGKLHGRMVFPKKLKDNLATQTVNNARFVIKIMRNDIYKLTIEYPSKLREIVKRKR